VRRSLSPKRLFGIILGHSNFEAEGSWGLDGMLSGQLKSGDDRPDQLIEGAPHRA
jgi:hypothetical protein